MTYWFNKVLHSDCELKLVAGVMRLTAHYVYYRSLIESENHQNIDRFTEYFVSIHHLQTLMAANHVIPMQ